MERPSQVQVVEHPPESPAALNERLLDIPYTEKLWHDMDVFSYPVLGRALSIDPHQKDRCLNCHETVRGGFDRLVYIKGPKGIRGVQVDAGKYYFPSERDTEAVTTIPNQIHHMLDVHGSFVGRFEGAPLLIVHRGRLVDFLTAPPRTSQTNGSPKSIVFPVFRAYLSYEQIVERSKSVRSRHRSAETNGKSI